MISTIEEIKFFISNKIIILTSMGGSPIHEGHTRLITDCKNSVFEKLYGIRPSTDYWDRECARLIVLVNSNSFLLKKHGYVFQDEKSRAEIYDSIKNVDYTFIYKTENTIEEAIEYLCPQFLCKGGNYSSKNMAKSEKEACQKIGTGILYDVGGSDKVESSSALLDRYYDWRFGDEFGIYS